MILIRNSQKPMKQSMFHRKTDFTDSKDRFKGYLASLKHFWRGGYQKQNFKKCRLNNLGKTP